LYFFNYLFEDFEDKVFDDGDESISGFFEKWGVSIFNRLSYFYNSIFSFFNFKFPELLN